MASHLFHSHLLWGCHFLLFFFGNIVPGTLAADSLVPNYSNYTVPIPVNSDPQEALISFCKENCIGLDVCQGAFPSLIRNFYYSSGDINDPVKRRDQQHDETFSFNVGRTVLFDILVGVDQSKVSIEIGPETDPASSAKELCHQVSLSEGDCRALSGELERRVSVLRERFSCPGGGDDDQAYEFDYASIPTDCAFVYVDLGSNDGRSVEQDLLAHDPGSPLSRWLHAHVWRGAPDGGGGGGGRYAPSDACVLGFEGNPRFTAALRRLEAARRADVRHLRLYTETIAGGAGEGRAPFFLDTTSATAHGSSAVAVHRDVGLGAPGATAVVEVGVARLSRVLARAAGAGASGAAAAATRTAVVKMDIEGSEYPILVDLLKSGFACDPHREMEVHLLLELHPFVEKHFLRDVPENFVESLLYMLEACGIRINTDAYITDSYAPAVADQLQ